MGRWQELQQAMSAGVEAAIDAGWDRQAVYGLVESAIKDTRFLPLEQAKTAVTELFSEVEEVGSSAYERLFRFSAYRPQEKLSLLLWQLGAVLDQHGMLQLVGTLSFLEDGCTACDVLGFVGKNSSKSLSVRSSWEL